MSFSLGKGRHGCNQISLSCTRSIVPMTVILKFLQRITDTHYRTSRRIVLTLSSFSSIERRDFAQYSDRSLYCSVAFFLFLPSPTISEFLPTKCLLFAPGRHCAFSSEILLRNVLATGHGGCGACACKVLLVVRGSGIVLHRRAVGLIFKLVAPAGLGSKKGLLCISPELPASPCKDGKFSGWEFIDTQRATECLCRSLVADATSS